jgi:CBS-domain-containing membrane protein
MSGIHPGALAARQTIPEAQHPRVSKPTAKSVLERFGLPCVPTVNDAAMVSDALGVMAELDVAAVAVMSREELIGTFSERDYARNCPQGDSAANNMPVAGFMTRFEAGFAPADSVRHCLALMNGRRLNHVAVLDQGHLAGLLSQAQLLAAQIRYYERVFYEIEMDQKLLFLRGTYSC